MFTQDCPKLSALVICVTLFFSGCGGSGGGSEPPSDSGSDSRPVQTAGRRVVFFGDSLTDGYQVPQSEAYPALVGQKIAAEGLNFEVINAGISGDTSADGLARVDLVLTDPPALFFLALGANDSRTQVPPAEMKHNLQQIIDLVRSASPSVRFAVAGIHPLADNGPAYSAEFAKVFSDLAAENQAVLMPSLLASVVGNPQFYDSGDEIHPNAAGHRVVAEDVARIVLPLLR